MDINALAQEVAKGIQQAQSASPIGGAPEIAAASASGLYNIGQNVAASGPDYNASVQVANDKAAQEAQLKAKQAEMDISKYKIVRKNDGGFDFFDPNGNQVDIATVAAKTGSNAADLVRNSIRPQDIQFNNDYKNLQDYISAVLNNDTATVEKYQAQDASLKSYSGKGGLDRLIQDFQKHYQSYYIPSGVTQPGQMLPSGSSGTDLTGLLQQLTGG